MGTASARCVHVATHVEPDASALHLELQSLAVQLRAHAVILYVPELTATGWEVAECEWVGPASESGRARLRQHVRAHGAGGARFGGFEANWIDEPAQNTVLSSPPVELTLGVGRPSLRASLALPHCAQLRMLLCAGPRLLAWLGALREASFTRAEHELLRAAGDSLRRVLLAKRQVAQPGLVGALLAQFEQPAFVLSQHGRVEYANGEGERWLALDVAGRVPELRSQTERPDVLVQPLAGTELRLVRVLEPKLELVLRRANHHWSLHERDRKILRDVLQGRSNKEIAREVGCAEVTVERRLTRMYKVAGVQSRAQLIVRLHALR